MMKLAQRIQRLEAVVGRLKPAAVQVAHSTRSDEEWADWLGTFLGRRGEELLPTGPLHAWQEAVARAHQKGHHDFHDGLHAEAMAVWLAWKPHLLEQWRTQRIWTWKEPPRLLTMPPEDFDRLPMDEQIALLREPGQGHWSKAGAAIDSRGASVPAWDSKSWDRPALYDASSAGRSPLAGEDGPAPAQRLALSIGQAVRRRGAYRRYVEALGADGRAAEMTLCAQSVAHWINHWVLTFDPRERGILPFDLFAKQLEFLSWLHERDCCQQDGLVEKSRDQGATWLCCAYATHGLLFRPGFTAGFGSLKREEVDEIGNLNTILEKCRFILRHIPPWMLPKGFRLREHATLCRIVNKNSDAIITGEGGDDMGRGGRSTIFFVDEAARLPRSQLVEAALSQTTRCRIDISTPNGPGNAFYRKRFGGHVPVFILDWHDDPRKDQAWYEEQCRRFDAVTVAQEIDRDYAASLAGIAIPALWVRAAINLLPREEAHGPIVVGFDVAEEGPSLSVLIARQGPIVQKSTAWGQINTTEGAWRARAFANQVGASEVVYDAGGAGAGIKGTWVTSEEPLPFLATPVNFGGEATGNVWPDGQTAKEKFRNLRAEMWWNLRARFERAYEFGVKGIKHPPEEMISIPNHPELIADLSTVLVEHTETGKIQLESKKAMKARGIKSPDYGDALALAFHVGTQKRRMQIW
jgi:hypothetical protein